MEGKPHIFIHCFPIISRCFVQQGHQVEDQDGNLVVSIFIIHSLLFHYNDNKFSIYFIFFTAVVENIHQEVSRIQNTYILSRLATTCFCFCDSFESRDEIAEKKFAMTNSSTTTQKCSILFFTVVNLIISCFILIVYIFLSQFFLFLKKKN